MEHQSIQPTQNQQRTNKNLTKADSGITKPSQTKNLEMNKIISCIRVDIKLRRIPLRAKKESL